jgi:hypothetical protein
MVEVSVTPAFLNEKSGSVVLVVRGELAEALSFLLGRVSSLHGTPCLRVEVSLLGEEVPCEEKEAPQPREEAPQTPHREMHPYWTGEPAPVAEGERICRHCGRRFAPTGRAQKFCTPACREAARKKR